MKTFWKIMFWVFCFPIMLVWVLFKGLVGLSDDMERSRKRRSRNSGVMCGPGGRGARGGRRRY